LPYTKIDFTRVIKQSAVSKIYLPMKKILFLLTLPALLFSCGSSDNGQLIGVQGRPKWYQADPFGMVYIPIGSFNMGDSDQDVPASYHSPSKTVSVQAFYMDQTEISNNEYRQFVYYVRDSLARRIVAENVDEDYHITENEYDEDLDPPILNWRRRIYWDDAEFREALEELYYAEGERYNRRREIDVRKLIYTYWWIDLEEASKYKYIRDVDDLTAQMPNRADFIRKDAVRIYPDTLVWIRDFTYSYNEPMAKMYFWHPAYDNYPVVGVNWKQATAFAHWRTEYMNWYLERNGDFPVHDFRLPTETEWEYAARGGLAMSPYPWGGPYIRNSRGCFLGNYKPMRGNYVDDGGFHTVPVDSYNPNEYGLYCMAGNVSEWTSGAFDEAGVNWMHDLNPDLRYRSQKEDHATWKRKIIRGGSWKDVGYYLQVSSRLYEFEDTSKSYIGFRCVQTYMGRDKGDAD
jgi:formylglycine-generating enzyme